MVNITVKGRNNYWRFTVYSWLLEIRDILERELGEPVKVDVVEGAGEDPELYVNGYYVGCGVPGEEGYLIEIIKRAVKFLRDHEKKELGNTEIEKEEGFYSVGT